MENIKKLPNVTHRPKGSMCIVCKHFNKKDCHLLNFTSMRKIGQDKDGVIVVRCSEFTKQLKESL